ncbi:MAG: hypothetical protein QGH39_03855 [Candidatus Thermoplasmatota archaeon]|jgi:hypothetical protein|nr:hypothetical protein [Candidatus Thermoplasmatota archaeon]MDP7264675.1 hypothetical protein [Candidatus Thermoplasmatota archaeon]
MTDTLESDMTDEMEELTEDIELYDFIESPECTSAMREYLANRAAEDGLPPAVMIGRADRLLDILRLNAHTLGCILNGDIVCIDGALFPRDMVRSDGRGILS